MGDTETRLDRLTDMDRKFAASQQGYTTAELATSYGVDPATIYRDINKLREMGTILKKRGWRYVFDGKRQLYRTQFTLDEILALYIAARLLSRHSNEANPHVVKALEKLADALRNRAPLMARHINEAAIAVSHHAPRPNYIQCVEALTQAWAYGRKVQLVYRSYTKGETTTRLFAPYFIEPEPVGYATYVIGYDDLRGTIRTLKIERIISATLTDEFYEIPTTFDPSQKLNSAWGINWGDESEPVEVQLRFTPHASQRIHESLWHSSQRIEDLPNGSCLFTVTVGATLELKPWIRQWGADVEVLAPQELREEIANEARAVAQQYSV